MVTSVPRPYQARSNHSFSGLALSKVPESLFITHTTTPVLLGPCTPEEHFGKQGPARSSEGGLPAPPVWTTLVGPGLICVTDCAFQRWPPPKRPLDTSSHPVTMTSTVPPLILGGPEVLQSDPLQLRSLSYLRQCSFLLNQTPCSAGPRRHGETTCHRLSGGSSRHRPRRSDIRFRKLPG